MSFGRTVHPSVVSMAAIALLAVMAAPVRGQVTDNKAFTLTVTDAVDAGDADAQIAITVTNTSQHQSLGSADVTVPEPFEVVAAPDDTDPSTTVLELRDLGLAAGASLTVGVTVDVQTCVAGTSQPFDAVAKQSNAFNGTGNDFFLDTDGSDLAVAIVGTCNLAFIAQPGDTERAPTTITSVDYEPQGPPIAVEVRDAADTGRATHSAAPVDLAATNPNIVPDDDIILLGGTTSATADAGLATFEPGPTLSPSAFDYTLSATSDFDGDGTDDAVSVSTPFDIVDGQVDCPVDEPCAAPVSVLRDGQRVTASFSAGARATSLVVSLGAADVPDFDCAGVPGDRAAAQYFFVGGDGDDRLGTLTLEIPDASQPVKAYKVCWAAPYPFATDGGGQSVDQGTKPGSTAALHVGVLPDCAKRGGPVRPCVSARAFNQRTSTATIEVQADGRDPWARS